jgi:DNA-binding NarL/FixJ family response regulator
MLIHPQRLFRECLTTVLSKDKGFVVVSQSTGQADALNSASPEELDGIILDADLPAGGALELTARLSLMFPRAKIIILGLKGVEDTFLQFIEAGASGYVSKEESPGELMSVIRMAHRGEAVCSPRIAYSVFSRVASLAHLQLNRQQDSHQKLTAREVEILELVAHGLSNKEIAEQLKKSLYTVKNHVHNILEKLQVHYRQEAIQCAYREGIIGKFGPAYNRPAADPGRRSTTEE